MVEQVEKQRLAWMKTAQQAEEWADQLGKVRLWLQEQLLSQRKELNAAHKEKSELAARLVAAQTQCQAMQTTLAQKHEELLRLEGQRSDLEGRRCEAERKLYETARQLHELEQSRGVRLLRWLSRRFLPAHSLRRRLAAKSVKVTCHLLRRG
jgi:chromosome segregation ATPase